MKIQVIKTKKFLPPKDNLWKLISNSINELHENEIVAITSKIISIAEGSCIEIKDSRDRDELAKENSSFYLPREFVPGGWFLHTIKNNFLIGSAGIDKSNAGNYFILWPKNPEASAKEIYEYLKEKYKVKNLGVIITDSHSVPLHRGLVGVSIAHAGFNPLRDYRGQKDIFGNELIFSQTNIPDSLAAAAVFAMGEGSEQTPIAIISGLNGIEFTDQPMEENELESFKVPFNKDLFYPFLKSVKWKKGGLPNK